MNVLDLFSGIGGFSLGLERAGMKTVAFCEIEPYAQRVLRKHWPDVPIYEDVREVTNERLRTDGIPRIDIVTGGFPCQDLSSAGKQAGITGERSGLWGELCRIIGEIRPKYAIVENVTNLLAGERGAWFGRLLGDLAEIGYDAEWHCIPASAVGANHHRDRVWIVAHPTEGLRDRVLLWSKINGQDAPKGFERSWALLRACVNGGRPQSDFSRIRKDDGLSARVGEIACFGNTVVPQIPEMLGRAIMAREAC